MADYSTRNIIDYAYDDDGKSFRDALYAEIHDRVANQFQTRKQDLAQSFLAPEQTFGLQPEDNRIGPMDSKDEPHDDEPGEIKKGKKQTNEEVEEISELSKTTLGKYYTAAKDDNKENADSRKSGDKDEAKYAKDRYVKRLTGMGAAKQRLNKEETEE